MPAGPRARLPYALSHSWTVKHQCVDLLAEGLWEELLDDEQPDITVMDWYVPPPTRVHTGAPQGTTPPRPPLWSEPPTRTLLSLQDPALPTSVTPSLRHLQVLKCARPKAVLSSSDACLSQDDSSLSFRSQLVTHGSTGKPSLTSPHAGPDYSCWSLPPHWTMGPKRGRQGAVLPTPASPGHGGGGCVSEWC